jgi:hypothetical protein
VLRFGTLLSLVLIFAPCASGARKQASTTGNSSGLIVLSRGYGKQDFIHIHNEDGSLWHKFTFYYDDSDGEFEYANEDFRPFAFHPDYFLLALKCVRKEAGRYAVIVNEKTGLEKYVKADDPSLKFETWEGHILKAFAVGFDRKVNPVLRAPVGRARIGTIPDVPFHPVAVRGEWLKIRWDVTNGMEKKRAKHDSGWIRWRRGARLLVELFYIS